MGKYLGNIWGRAICLGAFLNPFWNPQILYINKNGGRRIFINITDLRISKWIQKCPQTNGQANIPHIFSQVFSQIFPKYFQIFFQPLSKYFPSTLKNFLNFWKLHFFKKSWIWMIPQRKWSPGPQKLIKNTPKSNKKDQEK